MKPQNVLYALFFVSSALGIPVAEAEAEALAKAAPEAIAEPIAEAAPEAAPEALADPDADPTFWSHSKYWKKGTKFGMYGCNKKWQKKSIYVCPDGRLTYGFIYPGSVKFHGSFYNGNLYGNSVGNGYYGVGCNAFNYFVVGKYQKILSFKYAWSNHWKSKIIKSNFKFWCDDKGYICKEKPKSCNSCQEIEFQCNENESF